MASIPVKWFDSRWTGAPVLDGTAGSLLAVLDACLVDGFGLSSLDSLSRSGTVATAVRSAGHPFRDGAVIRIAGAQAPWNGDWRVRNVTTTSFQFDVPEDVPASAIGSLTARVAPLDWERPYAATGKAVYRATAGNRCFLRVDDGGAQVAALRGYQTMATVDSGTGPFPGDLQSAFGVSWRKSTSAGARDWVLVGDSQAFWLLPAWADGAPLYGFGELAERSLEDPYATLLMGHDQAAPASANAGLFGGQLGVTDGRWLPCAWWGAGAPLRGSFAGSSVSSTLGRGGYAFPAGRDTLLALGALQLAESGAPRGTLPGAWQVLHSAPLSHGDRLDCRIGGGYRQVLLLAVDVDGGAPGRLALDLTGPWR
ncbi:hypothetical protein [Chitinimonas koreensis]|uniref:hypothetical protein n=1 Tax=Chitinimonas koreensis TaxID=356302 RepID=UPI00041EFA9F|nr:hypothetical protein [Chitinimonas koreensis]QNM94896.1 hypothetical protein H9L41_13290 [Chitinimonas koreensis]